MNDSAHLRYLERIAEVTGRLTEQPDDRGTVSFIVEELSSLYEDEVDGELCPAAVLTSRILANLALRFGRSGIQRERELEQMEATESEFQKIHRLLLKKNMALRERTMVDELTGLFNRRYFERNLHYDFERFKRYHRPFSIVLFDVDHFKKVNDTFGHAVGDEILKHLAELAKSTVRSADMVARWGGEEFVLLLPETGLDGAEITSARLRETAMNSPLETEKGTVFVTISLGVLAVEGDFDGDAADIMRLVDSALYLAKERGRNRSVLAGVVADCAIAPTVLRRVPSSV